MRPVSHRFTPSTWSHYLVPILIGVLTLVLLATLVIIFLAVAGITPG